MATENRSAPQTDKAIKQRRRTILATFSMVSRLDENDKPLPKSYNSDSTDSRTGAGKP
jgi:hypothetical protein